MAPEKQLQWCAAATGRASSTPTAKTETAPAAKQNMCPEAVGVHPAATMLAVGGFKGLMGSRVQGWSHCSKP